MSGRWRIFRSLSCLAVAALMSTSGFAADPAPIRLDRTFAAIVTDPEHPLASLSVLAVQAGKVVYHRQFGQRAIDADDPRLSKPADTDTLYRIASISKLVTTLGVMKMSEAGHLDLDRDVGEYLGYRLRNPNFPDDAITLRMLLSHRSSLRDDAGYYWEAGLDVDLKDVLVPGGRLFGTGAMWATNARPGAYFQYANLPWGVVGTIMERVSGERFDRLMQRLVLVPLGLHGGFNPAAFTKADLENTATLYRKMTELGGKEYWDPAGPWYVQVDDYRTAKPVPRARADYRIGSNGTLFGPQGNCRLSAAGLGTIMLMLMHDGMHRGQPFLQPASVSLMLSEQWRHDGSGMNGNASFGAHRELMHAWGLGNQHFLDIGGAGVGDRLVEGGGVAGVGHLGEAWGLTSALVFDPQKKDGMIFLIGGPGFDPATYPGSYSALYRHEEKILSALYNGALRTRR